MCHVYKVSENATRSEVDVFPYEVEFKCSYVRLHILRMDSLPPLPPIQKNAIIEAKASRD